VPLETLAELLRALCHLMALAGGAQLAKVNE
jgi:hypothetical protein